MDKPKDSFTGKQNILNMVSQAVSFIVNMLIGFFLTPYIVEKLGSTAYGFVGLTSNFVTYASLITTALNSMAGRFIAMSFFKNDIENVRKYYSSVFIADIVICLLLTIPSVLFILLLPNLINVPNELLNEVTALFIFVFLEFFISICVSAFHNSAYVMNRIDLVASKTIESKILRLLLILAIFSFFAPHLWYIGLIGLVCAVYIGFRTCQIHARLLPDIKVRKADFEFSKVKELVSSGVWNSISSLGSILTDSLDLLIVNTMVSSAAMGIVSVAKTVPIYISSILISIVSTFAPTLTKLFAEDKLSEIKTSLLFFMKIVGGLLCIPFAIIVVFGKEFFTLWVPSQDSTQLWILAILTVSMYPISLSFAPMGYVFTSANKVKINSLVTIGFSLASVGTTFVLLSQFESDMAKMVVVILTSRVFNVLQNILFTLPYISKLIGCKKRSFYGAIAKNALVSLLVCAICFAVKQLITVNSWITLILAGLITVIVGVAIVWLLLLSKQDRNEVMDKMKCKIKKSN